MIKLSKFAFNLYQYSIFKKTFLTLCLLSIILGFFAFFAKDFELDVSPDSLVLEQDQDLEYYRSIAARYGSDEFLIITYTPIQKDLFSQEMIADLQQLEKKLLAVNNVESVISILNVPLLNSPQLKLKELKQETRTLLNPKTDFELAKKELKNSPLYRKRLVSEDGSTTAVQVNFAYDHTYHQLRKSRDRLREKRIQESLTQEERQELTARTKHFKEYSSKLVKKQNENIAIIRSIIDQHKELAEIHLGGVPMIINDMMEFISHDLKVFGLSVVLIMSALLIFIFRRIQWLILPIITAVATCLVIIGLLGLVQWKVTVVSANFLSLLIIFTLSLTIHLIVQYRELCAAQPNKKQYDIILQTLQAKFIPCLYTIVTTIVAFASLIVSNIRPVIDFGWIMVIGLVCSFIFSFTLFPALLILFAKDPRPVTKDITTRITSFFAEVVKTRSSLVVIVLSLLIFFSIKGILNLTVENRFIDYFKQSTEIYQGMYLIDEKLGGTTPLDLIVDAPQDYFEVLEQDDFYFEDEFESETEPNIATTSYWFTSYMFNEIDAIHDYLDSLKHIGKVLSLSTAMKLIKELNNGEEIENYELGILYNKLPKDTKNSLLSPYISEDGNQIRLAMRIYDSDPSLNRNDLLQKIKYDLTEKLKLDKEQIHLTGMAVLYNNMLQSLFKSQILTLGAVFFAVFIMFAMLFRSIRIALIAICPNLVAAVFVLGLMGLLGIPLNIMTITIAAISVGIAVDDTIHYLHRFENEIKKDWDYPAAINRSHITIGKAMYYTTLTITIGFSVMIFSNFVPTVYFGILTAMAMLTALVADLTILPILLNLFKPYRK